MTSKTLKYSRKKTGKKKTKKKIKLRPSPSKKAFSYRVGSQKKGNDGNWYVVTKRKNDIKYWRKLNKIEAKCKKHLRNKIIVNIKEFEKGKYFKSRKQAIAVAYKQIIKKYPECSSLFSR